MNIGRFKIGVAPLSMAVVFIIASVIAIISAFSQYRQEWSMPLSYLIMVNECLALIITLVYGIIVHVISALFLKHNNR